MSFKRVYKIFKQNIMAITITKCSLVVLHDKVQGRSLVPLVYMTVVVTRPSICTPRPQVQVSQG